MLCLDGKADRQAETGWDRRLAILMVSHEGKVPSS